MMSPVRGKWKQWRKQRRKQDKVAEAEAEVHEACASDTGHLPRETCCCMPHAVVVKYQFLTLHVSPPAHPETTPRRVEVIREVWEQRRGQPNRAKEG